MTLEIEAFNSDPNVILLKRWTTNCLRSQIANYKAATMFSRRNYWLGIPSAIFSAIVGTSVFAALGSESVDQEIQILIGIISVSAAVLAALQTFLRWGELAAKCRSTAAEYGAVKRQIDQMLSAKATGEKLDEETISVLRKQMDTLSRDAPVLPENIWDLARTEIPLAKK